MFRNSVHKKRPAFTPAFSLISLLLGDQNPENSSRAGESFIVVICSDIYLSQSANQSIYFTHFTVNRYLAPPAKTQRTVPLCPTDSPVTRCCTETIRKWYR